MPSSTPLNIPQLERGYGKNKTVTVLILILLTITLAIFALIGFILIKKNTG